MPTQNTLNQILLGMSRALSPLQNMATSLDSFGNFLLTELGWDANDIPQPVRDLAGDIGQLVTLIEGISDSDEIDNNTILQIAAGLLRLIDDIVQIAEGSDTDLLPSLIAEQFLEKLPDELLQYLLVEYLRHYHPMGYAALHLLGIMTLEEIPDVTPARPPHVKRKVIWSNFVDILARPKDVFRDVYGWGDPDFKFFLFAFNIAELLGTLGFSANLAQIDNAVAMGLEEKSDPETGLVKYYLKLPFASTDGDVLDADFGIGLFPLPQNDGLMPGFVVMPYGSASIDERVRITDNLYFVFDTNLTVAGGVGIVIRPDQDVKIFAGFEGGDSTPVVTGGFKAGLLFSNSGATAIRLITISSGSYLEMQSISIYLGAALLASDNKDFFVEFELKGGKLTIGGDGSDGFLSAILPSGGINATFDLTLGISSLRGFYFSGGGGLEIKLPAHIQLGPIDIQSLTISAKPGSDGIPLNLGADIQAALGPLQAVVENMGLSATLSLPSEGGNLGPMDLALGFKPPNGVGLSIDAGVVTGGGYLYFDFDNQEYAGVLELDISGIVTVKAIGLITTRMPDGSQGFSLLVIITAEFGSGIQLGFGFVLIGLGGLVGLNRTMRLQPLVDGVRTGSVNHIMFPTNIIQNAPQIISDLRAIFPPQQDIFLIGPMAKLGWGSPSLITLSLGVIIEIPGNIAILGVLRVILPDEDAELLVLQVAFVGAIEFDKDRLWFFASMFESRVLFMTLEGEMGLLVAWGADANFVVSVGGFHPQFTPPPLPFPNPRRISIKILDEDNARLEVNGYFAVTSNTVQFGAHIELFFGCDAFSISGHLGFDALFQFSPFYFIIQISAGVSLTVFGLSLLSIALNLSLEGPTPWRAKGTGSITILFFTITASFDVTWGEQQDTSLPPVEVMPLLRAEFDKVENWKAELPDASHLLVSLRALPEGSHDLVLHPVGQLRVSQRLAPLDLTLDKLGSQKPSDASLFHLSVTSPGLVSASDASEPFAMAQFKAMDDTAKLTSPAFEPYTSGLDISGEGHQLSTGRMVKRVVRYEQVIIDNNFKRFARPFFELASSLFGHFLKGGAASRSVLSKASQSQLQPFEHLVQVKPAQYGVAHMADNTLLHTDATFTSQAMAQQFLQQQLAADPSLSGTLHVIPSYEVNGS